MLTFTGAGPGQPRDPDSGRATRSVSPGLLGVLGIPLAAGRGIEETDGPGAESVAVLDQSYARASELPAPVVGKTTQMGFAETRVIGVVPDLRVFPDASFYPAAYVPFAVPPQMGSHYKVEVVARFREGPTAEQLAALSRLPSEVDASMRATATTSVRERRIRQLGAPLLAAVALGIFAAAGLLLAVVGGIGHIADFVVREAHATAVRMALGADPGPAGVGGVSFHGAGGGGRRVARDAARLVRVAGGGGPGALDRDRGSAVLPGAGGAAPACHADRVGGRRVPDAARRSVGGAEVAVVLGAPVRRRSQAASPSAAMRADQEVSVSFARLWRTLQYFAKESSTDCSRRSWTTAPPEAVNSSRRLTKRFG